MKNLILELERLAVRPMLFLSLHCYAKNVALLAWMTRQFMESSAKVLTR